MSRWPALRTPRGGLDGLTLPKLILAMLICLIVPMACGLVLFFASGPLGDRIGYAGDGPILTMGLGLMLIYSPLLAWVGLVPGVPLFLLALSRGWAGWISAATTGAAIGLLFATLVKAGALFALFGALNALIFWLALRWLHPKGFGVA